MNRKEDLVAAAVSDQLRDQRERLAAVGPGRAGLEQIVRAYLSPEHRDNPEDGCPSAALLDEITRCTDPTRQAYTDSVLALADRQLADDVLEQGISNALAALGRTERN